MRVIIIFQALRNFHQAFKMIRPCSFTNFYSNTLVIKLKGKSQNDGCKKNKAQIIFQNLTGAKIVMIDCMLSCHVLVSE